MDELRRKVDDYLCMKDELQALKRKIIKEMAKQFAVSEHAITDSVIAAADALKLFGRDEEC
jgi:hypothetical protein